MVARSAANWRTIDASRSREPYGFRGAPGSNEDVTTGRAQRGARAKQSYWPVDREVKGTLWRAILQYFPHYRSAIENWYRTNWYLNRAPSASISPVVGCGKWIGKTYLPVPAISVRNFRRTALPAPDPIETSDQSLATSRRGV